MDASEIDRLVAQYNRNLPEDSEVEARLSKSISGNRLVTLKELKEIIEWKFQGDGQKLPRLRRLLKHANEDHIRELSGTALSRESALSDLARAKILDQLPTVGPKVASVILTFWDPQRFGVYDFHVWDALSAEHLVTGEHEETNEEYVEKYLPVLRKQASKFGRSVREVEKAYYWKDAG